MPLLSTFGAASARGFGNLSGIALPSDDLWNTVSFLSHFDGTNNGTNNSFDDSSSSNHTITANGNVTQGSFGPFARPDGEWGVNFSNDFLTISGAGDFLGDYTLEAWVFVNAADGNYVQITYENAFGGKINVVKINNGTDENWLFGNNNTPSQVTQTFNTTTFSSNTWTHIAVVRSSNVVSVYINGVADSSTPSLSGGVADFEVIGGGRGLSVGSANLFEGNISNVRFSSVARYTSNFTPSTFPFSSDANTDLLTCQNNRFVDNSSNARAVVPSGDAAVSAFGPFLTSEVYDAGVNGASAYFDGSDGLSSSASTDYEFGTGDVTVEYWAYPTASGAIQNILDNRAEASGWKLGRDASNRFQVYNEVTSSYLFESGTFPENAWSHFCWTRASGVNKFFINGVQSGSNVSDSSNFNSNSLNIGVQHAGNTQYFTGYITCCRVIKGTAVEPSGVPSAPPTAITNTKLLLNMADGQAIDSAAQNNLTLYGDAKISNTQSKFGGTSMVFDGTGDYAYIPDGFPAFGPGDLTIEFWINPSNVSNNKVALYDARDNQSDSPIVWQNNAGIYLFAASDRIIISSGLSVGTWAHVALVRSSGVYKLYLDGTASGTTYANTDALVAKDLYIAGRYTANTAFYNGYIDDFRISSTARYTSNFTPPTEPFADKGQ